MNVGQNLATGHYGAEDHFGDYGAGQHSGQAHNGGGLFGHAANQVGYGSGHDPSQYGQHPDHMGGAQHYDETGGQWDGDQNGGEWNPGDGQDPEEWDGDHHLDHEGGAHHFSECDDHHDQQGIYHHTGQSDMSQTAQGGMQHPALGGMQHPALGGMQHPALGGMQHPALGGMHQDPNTQHVVHHVVHHDAQNGYQDDPHGGQGWDGGYHDPQQGGQGWGDGVDQGGEDFDPSQWIGQPLDHNDPGHTGNDEHGGLDAHSGGQQAPDGHAMVPSPAHPQDVGQHAPVDHAPGPPPAHPQDAGQHAPVDHAPVPPAHPQGGGQPAPAGHSAVPPSAHLTGGAGGFYVELKNTTTSSNAYAYITGQAIDHGNALFILGSDGQTAHYPPNPSWPGAPLSDDCGIYLGQPGNTVAVTIPHIAGGRIWFSIDAPLKFSVNPGPALMEPSVTNKSDPNFNTNWGFCELTFSSAQLYANISYVDFVGVPISLELTTESGGTQKVAGMGPSGLDDVCQALHAQHATDGKGWDQLVVTHNGRNLRALSPNQGLVSVPGLLADYFDEYINQVWDRLSKESVSIDTQAAAGKVVGHVSNGVLNFGGTNLKKPTTHDIFTCSTGPFQTGSDAATNAIIPRIGAAFNRSTLLTSTSFPEAPSEQYKGLVTNHYSRIVHKANLDGKGYAFPYDDVQQTGGPDQSGEVHANDPKVLTVTIGGGGASGHH